MDFSSYGALSALRQEFDRFPISPPQTEYNPDPSSRRASASENIDIDIDLLPPLTRIPDVVLHEDRNTPDSHVPRDARLVRLTGNHPFNAEAPLSELFTESFLTSPELFYVRNHGAVPQVEDQDVLDWQFTVEGCVENSLCLTVQQLMSEYDQISCPVTLVCAGNRRKEQNQLRKSQGFSWGPGGISTAIFTGVLMGDLVRKAKPRRGARFVCMEGADKLPNGHYGTSVKLNWVMDPNKGIMLAYKMNGEMLRADHGKPLRAVVPGQIGGRSVKWLKRLIITEAPSDNWYHIYDNRVLPTMVSPEESAKDSKWWKDERYAIYDLSTNSVIAYPEHAEHLHLASALETYRAKGYAYGGGGRRVTRVELSLDQGRLWRLANINYIEDRYRGIENDVYGGRIDMSWRETCYCWCFWSLDIPVSDLAAAKDVLVRAMDDSMNLQPKEMYWSVLGMMNNSWFRVAVIKEGEFLRFEHPTQPGLQPGGWMERVKKAGGDLADGQWGEDMPGIARKGSIAEEKRDVVMTKKNIDRTITIRELRNHRNEPDPWFVVNGDVYEGASFLREHPGGAQSILGTAGLDASNEFMAIHSETAKNMMQNYHIGTLDSASKSLIRAESETPECNAGSKPSATFLKSRLWGKSVLYSKRPISPNTRHFTFKLDHISQNLGLPIGQHLLLRLRDTLKNEVIIRPYTPISSPSQVGFVDLLVKIYPSVNSSNNRTSAGGMTQLLDKLPLGSEVDMKGPLGKFEYLGQGLCSIKGEQRRFTRFVMLCAGTGITPIVQVFRAVMADPGDHTTCVILNGNRTECDILCKAELDALSAIKETGRVLHTLSQPAQDWGGLRGRIDEVMLREYVPRGDDGDKALVMVCGPEGFESSMKEALRNGGWEDIDVLFF